MNGRVDMEGLVESISTFRKGIKLGDKWYNPDDRIWEFCKDLQVGDKVKLSLDKGNLTFIQLLEKKKESPQIKLEEKEGIIRQEFRTPDQIMRTDSLIIAKDLAIALQNPEGLSEKTIKDLASIYYKWIKEGI